jgi:hypothetical protein
LSFFLIIIFFKIKIMLIVDQESNGDWGLGIGDWGLGIGPNPQSPIPNPPIPILSSSKISIIFILKYIIIKKNDKKRRFKI